MTARTRVSRRPTAHFWPIGTPIVWWQSWTTSTLSPTLQVLTASVMQIGVKMSAKKQWMKWKPFTRRQNSVWFARSGELSAPPGVWLSMDLCVKRYSLSSLGLQLWVTFAKFTSKTLCEVLQYLLFWSKTRKLFWVRFLSTFVAFSCHK